MVLGVSLGVWAISYERGTPVRARAEARRAGHLIALLLREEDAPPRRLLREGKRHLVKCFAFEVLG
jgi:hypothetical protein